MRMKLVLTAQAALESNPDGGASTGRKPNSGHTGSTVSARAADSAQGPGRGYTTSVVIDGTTQSAHAMACREPDGTRRIES
jgi:surface antigen